MEGFFPRLSLVYDITGDGKDLIKLSGPAMAPSPAWIAGFINPVGWTEIDL